MLCHRLQSVVAWRNSQTEVCATLDKLRPHRLKRFFQSCDNPFAKLLKTEPGTYRGIVRAVNQRRPALSFKCRLKVGLVAKTEDAPVFVRKVPQESCVEQ